MALAGGALALLPAYTCGGGGGSDSVHDAPDDKGIPFGGDPGPAPTGQRFDDAIVQDGCGRTTLAFRLVDEICGAALGTALEPPSNDLPSPGASDIASPAELAAPMLRDGAFLGDTLYAVDGASLWVVDATTPAAPVRRALASGVGQALAVAVDALGGVVHVAAGEVGVVTLAPNDAGEALEVVDVVALAGVALDVDVTDGLTLAALGGTGLAVISGPAGDHAIDVIDVGGPAVAVAVDAAGARAYVATCDGLAIVDVPGRALLGAARGAAFVPDAIVDGINNAPAKDVAYDARGGVAYVAAGRYGVVGIDVTDAAAARAVGQCTDRTDLAHYVSGVKVDDAGRLVIAAGERGVVVEDDPLTSCASGFASSVAVVQPLPLVDAECAPMPPWDVLSIVTWEPPPPHHDPVQVALHGGRAFAFGDARRNEIRAIDVWTLSNASPDEPIVPTMLDRTGRYEEPRLVSGIAASDAFVVVAGAANANARGSVWRIRDGAELLVRVPDEILPIDAARIQGTPVLRADGTIASLAYDTLVVARAPLDAIAIDAALAGGATVPAATVPAAAAPAEVVLPGPISLKNVVARTDGALLMARADGIVIVTAADPDGAGEEELRVEQAPLVRADAVHDGAALAPDIVDTGDDIVVAAPEWDAAVSLARGASAPHAAFDAEEILDLELWRAGPPRRTLAVDAARPGVFLEVAAIADRGALLLHGPAGVECGGAIPAAPYVDAALAGDRAFLVATDAAHYRSELVTVDVSGALPAVIAVDSFNGAAVSMTMAGGRLYVADAEGALRIYRATDSALLDVVDVRGAP
jgi:hypothetical protein